MTMASVSNTGALGLLLHFGIAFSAATVFCVSARGMPALLRFPVMSGAVYGIVVFLVINRVVLPLSKMPKRTLTRAVIVTQLLIHVVCVGLPIVLAAKGAGL